VNNEQREKLVKLIAEFGALKRDGMQKEAEEVHADILDIIYPEDKKEG
jgi:hypothetical protein